MGCWQISTFAYGLFSGGSTNCGYNPRCMVSLMRRMSHLEPSETRRVEALVLLLALACLFLVRIWPASSFKVLAMMPMQMAASPNHVAVVDEVQSHHTCFDDASRCMSMMGGLCPLTQTHCTLTSAPHWAARQVQFPVNLVASVWSSRWPAVPKQPPRL